MKRGLLILTMVLTLSFTGRGQENFNVIDWKAETTLRNYLLQQMHCQYDLRRQSLEKAMSSAEAMDSYRELCRKRYLDIIGPLPSPSPLDVIVTNRTGQEGYTLESVIIETRPGHHMTASLYIPDDAGPLPAALFLCGHEMTSKATESYRRTAVLFALNGLVVMVADPVSQGERVQFTDSVSKPVLRGSTTEHTLLNAGLNLLGTSLAAWELYDNARALDYLCSRPEVDPQRIGCLGNSGGGTQTAYLIAFDDRIKAAAPCSYIASRERNWELTGANDGCQHMPYEGREQLEISDFMIMFAPKPLLILAGRYDFVDYTGTDGVYRELKDVYRTYGLEDRVSLFTWDDGHGISKPKREAAAEWFVRWLCGREEEIEEKDICLPDVTVTWCTTTGQVNSTCPGERGVTSFVIEEAARLNISRTEWCAGQTVAQRQRKISDFLGVVDGPVSVQAEVKGRMIYPGYSAEKILLRRDGEPPLPCLVFVPEKINVRDTIIILLSEEGKTSVASQTELMTSYLNKGIPVVLADLRGMGETAEKPGANDPKYYNREYNNAMLAIHTGRPLAAQRTEDVRTLMAFIAGDDRMKEMPVNIIADGAAAQPALFAAVLDSRISSVIMSSTIASYKQITENPLEKDWYSYVIPGVLRHFDLPDMKNVRPGLQIKYMP